MPTTSPQIEAPKPLRPFVLLARLPELRLLHNGPFLREQLPSEMLAQTGMAGSVEVCIGQAFGGRRWFDD
jgi:hypothetical protein|eukprot:COSAG02_NODE_434_length_22429_cov_15.013704_8_plen_70_part_00